MALNAPAHIAELLGKRVRVTGPYGSWEGVLSAYAPDPSVIVDGPAGRVCLPASYEIAAAPEGEPWLCPACNGSGSVVQPEARHVELRRRPPEEVRARLLCPDSPLPRELAEALADEIAPEGP